MSKKRETNNAGFVWGPQPPKKSIYSSECYLTRNQDFAKRSERKVNFLHKASLI